MKSNTDLVAKETKSMPKMRYDKAKMQRNMWRNGTEQFALLPVPVSKAEIKKLWKILSKRKTSATASEVQTMDHQQLGSPSSRLTRAQKKSIARKKAKELKAQPREQKRQRVGGNDLEKAVTASRLSAKQLSKLQHRNRARLVALAIKKHNPRAERPVHVPSSVKPDPKK